MFHRASHRTAINSANIGGTPPNQLNWVMNGYILTYGSFMMAGGSLAVSVVEKERAGMVTGIFNVVRVLADGLALAVLGVLLAVLIQSGLSDFTSGSILGQAASRAAIGDLAGVNALLPELGNAVLISYGAAFRTVLFILSGASVATALVIFALLGRVRA
ncbi:hypothetical protein ABLB84_02370 [Xenorhabdus szentirmaii]|uniref:hypothetical protein n=1 Tax=Xenorhabdus szentirmaii TaxID=290112 RepID=UPI0032B73FDF